eukprot:gene54061-15874_t
MDADDRRRLLRFVTGADAPPHGGCHFLFRQQNQQLFDHNIICGAARLPTAATCFHQLSVPAYATEERMRGALLTAARAARADPVPPRRASALRDAPRLRGGRPLVNIGNLCSQLRREQRLLLEAPPGAPRPGADAGALMVPPGGLAQQGALPPGRGKVNYDVLLSEQREMNKRRLEGERVYEEMLDKFEAYQAKLLQLLPHQSVFGNYLTDDLAEELERPTETIDTRGAGPCGPGAQLRAAACGSGV